MSAEDLDPNAIENIVYPDPDDPTRWRIKELRDVTMTLYQAAELMEVSTQTLRNVSKEGYIEGKQTGRVKLVHAVRGYLRYLKDKRAAAGNSQQPAATRVREARARQIELKVAKEEGQLIDIDEAINLVDEIVGTFKSQLSGIPARVTTDIELRDKIEKEIDVCLDSIARLLSSQADALRTGGEIITLDEEDDA